MRKTVKPTIQEVSISKVTQIALNSKVQTIVALCLDINVQTPYASFFSFSGHVRSFSGQIKKTKDVNLISVTACLARWIVYLDPAGKKEAEKTLNDLDEIITNLHSILRSE